MTVLSPAEYNYTTYWHTPAADHVTFRVRADSDAHVVLAAETGQTEQRAYEVVICGWDNTR